MSPLGQALSDYLQLRRSLGHELAEARWLLPGFVAYLDAHGIATVTVEATLDWAQQSPRTPTGHVTTVGPRRMTVAHGCAAASALQCAGTVFGAPLWTPDGHRISTSRAVASRFH